MRRRVVAFALIGCSLALVGSTASYGQPAEPAAPAAAAPAATPAPAAGFQTDLLADFDGAMKHLVALAEAMPADKYGWRPGEGVRSFGEVVMHVAAGFYMGSAALGAPAPAGVDPSKLESMADKDHALAALKASIEHFRAAATAVPAGSLDDQVDLFGRKFTKRRVMLLMQGHGHEHTGQAIAYARMNGIVPPWSQPAAGGGERIAEPRAGAGRAGERRVVTSHALFQVLIGAVALERLGELLISRRHERSLRARGAIEAGAGHYPIMVGIHVAVLAAAPAEVVVLGRPFLPWLGWPMLALVAATMALRYWVVATLGERWATRVLVLPGEPLVAGGPFRFLRHPNYLAVAVEVVALPAPCTPRGSRRSPAGARQPARAPTPDPRRGCSRSVEGTPRAPVGSPPRLFT